MAPVQAINTQYEEIQGNVIRGYRPIMARYYFYEFNEGKEEEGRKWLKTILDDKNPTLRPTYSNRWDPKSDNPKRLSTLNIAFSHAGLKALGVSTKCLESFPEEFREGMLKRSVKILGDVPAGPGDDKYEKFKEDEKFKDIPIPKNWDENFINYNIHALVIIAAPHPGGDATKKQVDEVENLFGKRCEALEKLTKEGEGEFPNLVKRCFRLEGRALGGPYQPTGKEHFGYRDGISQPFIEGTENLWEEGKQPPLPGRGTPTEDGNWKPLKPGEFLLGYEDESGVLSESPTPIELGKNGTYLVFRKLSQDVFNFRNFLQKTAGELWGSKDAQELLAAKLMGRYRSGCPLEPSHTLDGTPVDDPKIVKDPKAINDFLYKNDPDGLRCPLGAHIRRTNPRDSILGNNARHRIIRRGLTYGQELDKKAIKDDGADRGVFFMAINASIGRQFELLQKQWVNKGEFLGLDKEERDPIIGANPPGSKFTVPGAPFPFTYKLEQFVIERGGEYFFYPSKTALNALANGEFKDPLCDKVIGKIEAAIEAEVVDQDLIDHIKNERGHTEEDLKKDIKELVGMQIGLMARQGTTPVKRGQHPKGHVCVKAIFKVTYDPDNPPSKDQRVGVFKDPREYDALIRFSNGANFDDTKPDIQGMAIKLFGVEGEKLLENEKQAETQDFLLADHFVFFASTVRRVIKFGLAKAREDKEWLHDLIKVGELKFEGFQKGPEKIPLYTKYWSQLPYKIGNSYVKYFVKPIPSGKEIEAEKEDPNFRRLGIEAHLVKDPAKFVFYIQPFIDPDQTPVNDPTKEWKSDISVPVKVAEIIIPVQDFNSDDQRKFCEEVSFTPWHSLEAHKPAGEISLIRKFAYLASSMFRHEANGVSYREPTGPEPRH